LKAVTCEQQYFTKAYDKKDGNTRKMYYNRDTLIKDTVCPERGS